MDLDAGEQLVKDLEDQKFGVSGALWYYNPDSERYQLILESPELKVAGRTRAYVRIQEVLERTKSPISLDRIAVVSTDSPIVKTLERAIVVGGTGELKRVRIRNSVFNGFRVEDAVIYRLGKSKRGAPKPKIPAKKAGRR